MTIKDIQGRLLKVLQGRFKIFLNDKYLFKIYYKYLLFDLVIH